MKKESGFINIIILVIIFVVVLMYFGKNPIEIWEKIKPLFVYAFDIFLKILDWLVRTITQFWKSE